MRPRLSLLALLALGCGTTLEVGERPDGERPDAAATADGGPVGDAPAVPTERCGPCAAGQTCSDGACVPAWEEHEVLALDDAQAGAGFGTAMAADDALLVVGAPSEGTSAGPSVGAAYVFERGAIDWRRGQRVASPAASQRARFGTSVAVSSGRLLVGAPGAPRTGAVYVFDRVGGFYERALVLEPPDAETGEFGCTVNVQGSTVVVGSNRGIHYYRAEGSAYRYRGASLKEQKSCPYRVVSSPTRLVAAHLTSSGLGDSSATISVVMGDEPAAATVTRTKKFSILDSDLPQIALEGTHLALTEESEPLRRHDVRVFDTARASLDPLGTCPKLGGGGTHLALSGSRLVTEGRLYDWTTCAEVPISISPPEYDVRTSRSALLWPNEALFGLTSLGSFPAEAVAGARFELRDSANVVLATPALSASEARRAPRRSSFGELLLAGDDVALVGAMDGRGVYLFERQSGAFRFKQTLERDRPGLSPYGEPVISGTTVAFGVNGGAVRVFERGSDGLWGETARLTGLLTVGGSIIYSMRLGLDGDRLGIHQDSTEKIFRRTGSGWELEHSLSVNNPVLFTRSRIVDVLSGDQVWVHELVGDTWAARAQLPAPAKQSTLAALSAGSDVFLLRETHGTMARALMRFTRSADGAWTKVAEVAVDASAADLSFVGDDVLVGEPGVGTGRARLFSRLRLEPGATLVDARALGGARFGASVVTSRDRLLIAEPGPYDGPGVVHVLAPRAASVPR